MKFGPYGTIVLTREELDAMRLRPELCKGCGEKHDPRFSRLRCLTWVPRPGHPGEGHFE